MRRPMPNLLKFVRIAGMPLGAFAVVVSVAFLAAAGTGGGPYVVQGAMVSRDEFMAFAVPVLVCYALIGVMSIAVAWGLRRERYWARPVMLALGPGMTVFSLAAGYAAGLPMQQVLLALLGGAMMSGSLWWYLYRRDDVVDWFEELREAEPRS